MARRSMEAKKEGEGKRIHEIQFKGLKNLEKDSMKSYLSQQKGGLFSKANVQKDVRTFFATGYFYDVRAYKESIALQGKRGVRIIYVFQEKPTIVSIRYRGHSSLEEDALSEVVEVKEFSILNTQHIENSQQALKELYESKGFFLADISYKIEPTSEPQRVELTFHIEEGERVRIKRIQFIGNKTLSDQELKRQMLNKEKGFFSFMSGAGSYKKLFFEADMANIQRYYFNKGYMQMKIFTPQVQLTPDQREIYITFHIQEGGIFSVGDIDFSGDLLFSYQELLDAVELDDIEIFSLGQSNEDIRSLQVKYGDLGYAFVNVIPRINLNEKSKKIDVVFDLEKGEKVYFGQINIEGNKYTRDKVIRRELKIFEGELYNESAKRESERRVRRLGYFSELAFNTKISDEKTNFMNLDIVVKERSTGSLNLNASYGNTFGLSLGGRVHQNNFLGRGYRLSTSIQYNKYRTNYDVDFFNPYFLDTQWQVGVGLYRFEYLYSDYEEMRNGLSLSLGYPLDDLLNFSISYKLAEIQFFEVKNASGEVVTDEELFPLETASGRLSSLSFKLAYDRRNDRFMPSKGIYTEGIFEYAGLGGDLKYLKSQSNFRYYHRLFWSFVWRNNLSYGLLSGHGGQEVPFNERFLLGGTNSLRGYAFYSVGKRKFSQRTYDQLIARGVNEERSRALAQRPVGGLQQLYANTELEFNLIKEANMRGVLFLDVGQAEDHLTKDHFFTGTGLGLRWFSPIGLLRFEWGFPLNPTKYLHRSSRFEFSAGNFF